jgi:uncharacterized membrane protein YkvI
MSIRAPIYTSMAVAPLSATFLGFAFLIASIYPQIIGRPVLERRYLLIS